MELGISLIFLLFFRFLSAISGEFLGKTLFSLLAKGRKFVKVDLGAIKSSTIGISFYFEYSTLGVKNLSLKN